MTSAALALSGLVFGAVALGAVTAWWRLSPAGSDLEVLVRSDAATAPYDGWRLAITLPWLGSLLRAFDGDVLGPAVIVTTAIALGYALAGRILHRRSASLLATCTLATILAAGPALATFTVPAADRPTSTTAFETLALTTPAAPACAGTPTQIDVTWGLGTTDSWADGHSLSRSVNAGAYTDDYALTTPRAATNYADTSVTSGGTTYTYKLRSKNNSWRSGFTAATAACSLSSITSTLAISQTTTKLADPEAAFEIGGYLFIADTTNHRVKKVNLATNTITTIAGDGTTIDNGVGTPATSFRIRGPEGIYVTGNPVTNSDTVWVSSTLHHRIRKLVNNGAGTYQSFEVVGAGGLAGDNGDGAAATLAKLDRPSGLVVASNGDIFFSDKNNNKIRWVDATNGNIYALADGAAGGFADGTCTAGTPTTCKVNTPEGMTIESDGDIYIADSVNQRVRKMTTAGDTFVMTTVAGNGTGTYGGDNVSATGVFGNVNSPAGVAVESDCASSCHLFIADTNNNRIRLVAGSTGTYFGQSMTAGNIYSIAGTGLAVYTGDGYPATGSGVATPQGVAVSTSGVVYTADTGHDMLRKITTDTLPRLVAAAGQNIGGDVDGTTAATAAVVTPWGSAIDSSGNVFFADWANHRIRLYIAATGTIATVAGTGTAGGLGDGGAATAAQLSSPEGIAISEAGGVATIFVADTANNKVRKFTYTYTTHAVGNMTLVAGSGTACSVAPCGNGGAATSAQLGAPSDVAIDDDTGDLFISDTNTNSVRKIADAADATPGTTIVSFAGTLLAADAFTDGTGAAARFADLEGIGFDQTNNELYIADTTNSLIRRSTTGAVVTTVAGAGATAGCGGANALSTQIAAPYDVAANAGTYYFTNTGAYRICKVTGTTISSVMGDGTAGTTGDGGAPGSARIEDSRGISVHATLGMYVSHSTATGRLRKVLAVP
ncbi:MAG: hypothetical protein ACT4OX_16505 [Actinomycetota bacterium]